MILRTLMLLPVVLGLLSACSAPSGLFQDWQDIEPPQEASTDSRKQINPKIQAQFDSALLAAQGADFEAALAEMASLWQSDQSLSGAALNSALINAKQNRGEAAQEWFLRAIKSNPTSPTIRSEYGVFLRQQGRFGEAQQQYQAALQGAPQHAVTHYNLAILYDLYMGDKSKALEHFLIYQSLSEEEDRQVKGWIADLRRQQTTDSNAGGKR